MMMDDRRVIFHGVDGCERMFFARSVRVYSEHGCAFAGTLQLKESYPEAIAILNAVLNLPGPGDVTLKQIGEALMNSPSDTGESHNVVINDHGETFLRRGDDVLNSDLLASDPLAAIVSLEPAPDPRDELQESHAELLHILKVLWVFKDEAERNAAESAITRAEKLTKEPAK